MPKKRKGKETKFRLRKVPPRRANVTPEDPVYTPPPPEEEPPYRHRVQRRQGR